MSLVHDALSHAETRSRLHRQSDQKHADPRHSEFSLPHGYEPIELAGMGAFAEVWKTIEIRTGRLCALKRLRPDRCDDATAQQLIRNEAQACQAAASPHLLKLLQSESRADVPYLVFEWLEGRTLDQELRDEGPLTLRRAVWVARQTADCMQDLERAGLAHGDIKPQNIFITLGGDVKLLDLGFVRPIAAASSPHPGDTLLGTPEYLAPESLVSGMALPVAKDMYALGVTLYRMLTGRLPFVGDSPAELMVQHRQTKPTLLRRYRPDTPRELSDLVGRMLAKQPFRRPHNLRSLIRELVDLEIALLTAELAS
jgi:eukaryotic-like serine/threonine-protein kinase